MGQRFDAIKDKQEYDLKAAIGCERIDSEKYFLSGDVSSFSWPEH